MSPNIVDRIRKEERERTLEDLFREAEENPLPGPGNPTGNNQHKTKEEPLHRNDSTRGNSQSYLARRLARDHEDIFGQLKAGEFPSVRAAARQRGAGQFQKRSFDGNLKNFRTRKR